jgi:site-specific DNA-cytosine methylase
MIEQQNPTLPIHGVMPRFSSVLSLFDGMSCGQIALNRVGIEYDNYFASEIDKHAIKVTQHNYPNTIQLGDVTKVKGSDLPKIDLLIGGSPCQGFSFAGKGLNFEDQRSKLFFEFVRLKNETQPKYWMLENVKMKVEYQNIISEILGVKPILINSKLVSAQSRERLYWTNIPIAALSDKNIIIADVVGIETDNKSTEIIVTKNIYPKKGQNGNVYSIKGKCKTLSAGVGITGNGIGSSNAPKIEWNNEQGWRRLTATECERLQTVPDNYTDCVSDTQRYKMLGNGWTVDVIAHIFGSFLNGA